MWEKVQLTVNRAKSSFLAWRIIAEENAPGSCTLSHPLNLPPFPRLPKVPGRREGVCPNCSLMIALGDDRVLRWIASKLFEGKKKKKSLWEGSLSEVGMTETARLWRHRWVRLDESHNFHESHFPQLCVERNK